MMRLAVAHVLASHAHKTTDAQDAYDGKAIHQVIESLQRRLELLAQRINATDRITADQQAEHVDRCGRIRYALNLQQVRLWNVS